MSTNEDKDERTRSTQRSGDVRRWAEEETEEDCSSVLSASRWSCLWIYYKERTEPSSKHLDERGKADQKRNFSENLHKNIHLERQRHWKVMAFVFFKQDALWRFRLHDDVLRINVFAMLATISRVRWVYVWKFSAEENATGIFCFRVRSPFHEALLAIKVAKTCQCSVALVTTFVHA